MKTFLRSYGKTLHDAGHCLRRETDAVDPFQRKQLILDQTRYRIVRNDSCDHVIHCGTNAVHIGPGSLFAACTALLDRSKTTFEDNRIFVTLRVLRQTGGTKVDQLESAILSQKNIVSADIAVQNALFVNFDQTLQKRFDQDKHFVPTDTTMLAHIILDTCAVHVIHDDTGSFLIPEEISGRGDALKLIESGGNFGFLHSLVHAGAGVLMKCLDRHRNIQRMIHCLIGRGKATASDFRQNFVAVHDYFVFVKAVYRAAHYLCSVCFCWLFIDQNCFLIGIKTLLRNRFLVVGSQLHGNRCVPEAIMQFENTFLLLDIIIFQTQ